MPLYLFKCKNPGSPYYTVPKQELMTVTEYEFCKNNLFCEVTGNKLYPIMSSGSFKINTRRTGI